MTSKLETAREALQSGQIAQAEALCRQALKAVPQDAAALTLLGTVLSRAGKLEESVKTLQAAAQTDKRSTEALIHLSQALFNLGRFEAGVDAGRQAIARNPDDAGGHAALGQCLLRLDRQGEALEVLRTACRLDSGNPSAHHNLGMACFRLGMHAEAEASLSRTLELAPQVLSSRLALGRVLFLCHRAAEAVAVLEAGLEYAPNDAELHLALALSLFEAEDAGMAPREADGEKHLNRSIGLRPQNDRAYGALGMRFISKGRFAEAKELLEKAIKLNPNQGLAYMELVRMGRFTRDQHGLLDQMHKVIQRESVSGKELTYLHYALAKAHDDLDEVDLAMPHYDAANRISYELYRPGHPFVQDAYAERLELVMKLFSADVLARAEPAKKRRPVPILVVGAMRSGTTLVEHILSSDPAVGACGELSFWQIEGAASYRSGRCVPDREVIGSLGDDYARLVGAITGPEARYATDKMPQNYEFLGLFHLAFPHAPIVYIKRNAADTCLSIYTTPYGNPPEFAYDRADIAFVYEEHLRIMEHWRTALPPGRFLEIGYEELVSDREPVIRRMLAYCGLDWDDACLSPEQNERIVRTPNRWEVRQAVFKSSVDRWKRYEPWLGEFRRLAPDEG